MSKNRRKADPAPDPRVRVETGAEMPRRRRAELVAEVRRRMEAGELDSELARIETAVALLDGDRTT